MSHSSQNSELPPRRSLRLVPQGSDEPDDPTLVRALVAGEEWAARATWNKYAPSVYGFLDRALGSAPESEDLTQEVFWRLFAGIRRLRDPKALRSFIYSSTIRILRWHLRKKRVRSFLLLSNNDDVPEGRAEAADNEGRDLLARFYRMLDKLKPDERTAFVLRHVEGLALQEIAEATGACLATVKRRINRASERIEVLGKQYPELAEYRRQRGEGDDEE